MNKQFEWKEQSKPTTPNIDFYYDEDGTMIIINADGTEERV
jgi:hypothetical protein